MLLTNTQNQLGFRKCSFRGESHLTLFLVPDSQPDELPDTQDSEIFMVPNTCATCSAVGRFVMINAWFAYVAFAPCDHVLLVLQVLMLVF